MLITFYNSDAKISWVIFEMVRVLRMSVIFSGIIFANVWPNTKGFARQ